MISERHLQGQIWWVCHAKLLVSVEKDLAFYERTDRFGPSTGDFDHR
jgi:hypothetical protein